MTATASVLAPRVHDPYGLDLPGGAPSSPGSRPALHVLPGGSAGAGHDDGPTIDLGTLQVATPVPASIAGGAAMVEVYRRRRFLVALALTIAILAVTQAMGISLTGFGASPAADEAVPVVHVVRPGDTYPAIAAELGADDPQAFAIELQRSNGGAQLVIGQRLMIDRSQLG